MLGHLEIMAFTEAQKSQFIALLQTKDWQLRDGTIWSPGGGLWFDEPHFIHYDPPQVLEMFTQRAARIAKSQIGNWQRATRENEEAAWAAEEVMRHD
jgi:hypothetical protein